MSGAIKAGLGTLIGNAGEYAVMGELLKRGIVAALAPRNAPSFDILATRGDRVARIRVKTKTGPLNPWQWMAKKDGTIFRDLEGPNDFVVLVTLGPNNEPNRYYVVPTRIIERWLQDDFELWKSTPGKKGQVRNAANRKRHLSGSGFAEKLQAYENLWSSLWEAVDPA